MKRITNDDEEDYFKKVKKNENRKIHHSFPQKKTS